MNILETIKSVVLSILGIYLAVVWFFGGFIGAIVAAFNDHLVSLVLCIFVPLYGFVYTIIMTLSAIF